MCVPFPLDRISDRLFDRSIDLSSSGCCHDDVTVQMSGEQYQRLMREIAELKAMIRLMAQPKQ